MTWSCWQFRDTSDISDISVGSLGYTCPETCRRRFLGMFWDIKRLRIEHEKHGDFHGDIHGNKPSGCFCAP